MGTGASLSVKNVSDVSVKYDLFVKVDTSVRTYVCVDGNNNGQSDEFSNTFFFTTLFGKESLTVPFRMEFVSLGAMTDTFSILLSACRTSDFPNIH